VSFEWRDWSEAQYQTGPHFAIRDAQLRAGGQTLSLPLGQWVHVEITAGLGKSSDGKWTLKATLPGQPPREFKGLAYGSTKFKKFTWLGFSSNANRATVFYLDNLAVNVK
jgi:hypothetical protein